MSLCCTRSAHPCTGWHRAHQASSHCMRGAAVHTNAAMGRRDALALTAATLMTPLLSPSNSWAKAPAVVETEGGKIPGERPASITSTGIRFSNLKSGTGDKVRTGDLVLIDLVGTTESGKVFVDTKAAGSPLAFEIGQTSKFIPEGLSQVVEMMTGGDQKLAVVPPYLGYGSKGVSLPQGGVPPNAKLYYEIELLRCQKFTLGLACCSEDSFPCIGKDKMGEMNAAAEASSGTAAVTK